MLTTSAWSDGINDNDEFLTIRVDLRHFRRLISVCFDWIPYNIYLQDCLHTFPYCPVRPPHKVDFLGVSTARPIS